MKLGKLKPVIDRRTLYMPDFFTPALPPPPPSVDHSRSIADWGMMLNGPNDYGKSVPADGIGDCVIAAKAHCLQSLIMSQILPAGKPGIIHPADIEILDYYEKWGGFDPDNPDATDNGMDMLTAAKLWRKEKFANYELLAFGGVDPRNMLHIKQAINLFGGVDVGLQMPVAWSRMKIWDFVKNDKPGTWGGHDVWILDYTPQGVACITWGKLQMITWRGFQWVCDEAFAYVVPDWVPPVGFDRTKLLEALKVVTS
jgi:hypothetical protein